MHRQSGPYPLHILKGLKGKEALWAFLRRLDVYRDIAPTAVLQCPAACRPEHAAVLLRRPQRSRKLRQDDHGRGRSYVTFSCAT